MSRWPSSLPPLRTIATAARPESKVEEVFLSSSHSTVRNEDMRGADVDSDKTCVGKVRTG
jgi:hypothetical protein